MGILYSLGVFWNSVRFLLNVERDEFVVSRLTAPSFTNPVFKLGMWHEKGSCIRRSPSLCNAFITQLASRNVFPEFVIIHTGIVCECNCCHLCSLLGKTAVSVLPESLQLPPKNEFVTEELQESRRPVNTFFWRNGNRQWILRESATGRKWLTFCVTTMMQRNQSAHTAWGRVSTTSLRSVVRVAYKTGVIYLFIFLRFQANGGKNIEFFSHSSPRTWLVLRARLAVAWNVRESGSAGYFSSGHVWFRVRMDWIGRRQGKAGGRKRCTSLHFR